MTPAPVTAITQHIHTTYSEPAARSAKQSLKSIPTKEARSN